MTDDLKKVQGTWNVTSVVADGHRMAVDALAGSQIVIKGTRFMSLGMGATYEGTIQIDPTNKPKQFDLLITAGHAAGTRHPGIYKLEAGKWTMCLATRGDKRPSTFRSRPGTGLALQTLARDAAVRSKRTAKPRPTDARLKGSRSSLAGGSGPATDWEGEWAMVSAVINGAALGGDMVKWCTRVTRGDVTTVVAGPQVMLKARFVLDPSTHPAGVDYMNLAGAHKGKSQLGVFEMSGDILKICMAAPRKPRPSEWLSKPGDGRSYTTWRFVKK